MNLALISPLGGWFGPAVMGEDDDDKFFIPFKSMCITLFVIGFQ